MRILSIHMNSTLNGGSEVVFRQANRLLANDGHVTAWLTIGGLPSTVRGNDSAYVVPELKGGRYNIQKLARHLYNPQAVNLAQHALSEFKPDIVHIHTIYGYRHLSPAVLLPFKKAHIPIIQTLHDYGLICPASFLFSCGDVCEACRCGRYYYAAQKACIDGNPFRSTLATFNAYLKDIFYRYDSLISAYITPSEFLRQKFIEFGFSPQKLFNVPNAYFHPVADLSKLAQKERAYLLFAGRLSSEKGVDLLLRAAQGLGFPIKIAGDGTEMNALQELAKHLRLSNVEFLGKQAHNTMINLYHNAAFTIMTSRWYENGPLAILESYAQATPVIAARIGAMPEFISESETGYLFTPNDSRNLHNILRTAIDNLNHNQRLEQNALSYVLEHHNPHLYIDRLEKVFLKHLHPMLRL